jgi:hypothetical protein
MHIYMQDYDKMLVLYVPHKKTACAKYRWRKHSRWQFALIPVVSSSGMTYTNMVSVTAKEHMSYLVFMPKPSTHHMHDPGSIVPHIRPKVLTDNQMS